MSTVRAVILCKIKCMTCSEQESRWVNVSFMKKVCVHIYCVVSAQRKLNCEHFEKLTARVYSAFNLIYLYISWEHSYKLYSVQLAVPSGGYDKN